MIIVVVVIMTKILIQWTLILVLVIVDEKTLTLICCSISKPQSASWETASKIEAKFSTFAPRKN